MFEFSEEECVVDSLALAIQKWPRAADAWEHITWVLSKSPKEGAPLNETGDLRLLIFAGAKSIGMPDIRLIYRIENPTLRLLDVEFTESTYGQAGHA